MATTQDQGAPEGHESAMDYPEHERSYALFIAAVKWSVISTAVIVVILYFVVQP